GLGDINSATLSALAARVNGLARDVALLRELLKGDPLIALARGMGLGDRFFSDAETVLAAAADLAAAGQAGIAVGKRFVAARDDGAADDSILARLAQAMSESTAEVDRMTDLVARAGATLDRLPPDANAQINSTAAWMRGAVERYQPQLEQLRAIQQVLPRMLGLEGPQRYLVLAQNPAELRPTGGYAGTVGIIGFDHGRVTERAFQDVYLLDLIPGVPFVEPPVALADHLLGDQSWKLADANWSPDFATSARRALELYSLESGDTDVAGVIALTTYAVDRLLEVIGPVEVPGYGVSVLAGEVTMTALGQTRGISVPGFDRKKFLGDLANTVIDRLFALSPDRWDDLFAALSDIADERLMLAWFNDPAAQALIADAPVGGAVRDDPGDYLYVVEANVSPPSKYNLVVDRTDELTVTLAADGSASTTLAMDWANNALTPGEPYASLRSYSASEAGLYGSYVRVLAPASAQLTSAAGAGVDPVEDAEEISTEAGRAVFGNYLLIAPGTAELEYDWTTNGVSTQAADGLWTYRLVVQKQPGLRPVPLSVLVDLPANATIEWVSEGAIAVANTISYATALRTDTEVVIRYRLP
ncbi:MAG: DUF4012 domain-containing protein, partial [Chloroflexota bacterium]